MSRRVKKAPDRDRDCSAATREYTLYLVPLLRDGIYDYWDYCVIDRLFELVGTTGVGRIFTKLGLIHQLIHCLRGRLSDETVNFTIH
jgi:hypothetical protein